MSVALALSTRTCPACDSARTCSPVAAYCAPCFRIYFRAKSVARELGRPIEEWRPAFMRVESPVAVRAVNEPRLDALEADLDDLFRVIFEAGGFGYLQELIEAGRKRLARRNRAAVDAEGWIV